MISPALELQLAEKRARGQRRVHGRAPKPKKINEGEENFAFQCRAMKLPAVVRKWKMPNAAGDLTPKTGKLAMWEYDFTFHEQKVIVEIDGGIWRPGGGAHSHPIDIRRNMTKQNDAALAGFIVLRFTPEEVKAGHAIALTQRVLATRGWKP